MNSTTMMVIAAVALPVSTVAVWIWIVVERVDRAFRAELKDPQSHS